MDALHVTALKIVFYMGATTIINDAGVDRSGRLRKLGLGGIGRTQVSNDSPFCSNNDTIYNNPVGTVDVDDSGACEVVI